jgi:hypothetical protein
VDPCYGRGCSALLERRPERCVPTEAKDEHGRGHAGAPVLCGSQRAACLMATLALSSPPTVCCRGEAPEAHQPRHLASTVAPMFCLRLVTRGRWGNRIFLVDASIMVRAKCDLDDRMRLVKAVRQRVP